MLVLGPTQTDRKKFRVGAENAVLQPADTGQVARAFRAARDRQAVPQGPHRRPREDFQNVKVTPEPVVSQFEL